MGYLLHNEYVLASKFYIIIDRASVWNSYTIVATQIIVCAILAALINHILK